MEEKKMFLSSNLKYLRETSKYTQKEIASMCGKGATAIGNWEAGIREPSAIDLYNLSQTFNVSITDLISKDLRFDNAELVDAIFNGKVPVLGTIKAGIPIEAQQDIVGYVDIPKEWTKGGKKYFALKISGDSMSPKYLENDIVIFEQTQDIEKVNKKDCAVLINGNDATFKNITISDDGITLVPLNINNSDGFLPRFYDKEQIVKLPIVVLGVAIEKRTKLWD